MKIACRGVQIASTDSIVGDRGPVINAELTDDSGNIIDLFFDSLEDLELLAHELKSLAETVREKIEEPDAGICAACNGSGMGISGPSKCLNCNGTGDGA